MHLTTIARAVWPPFVFWLVAVHGVTFGGHQPGVVCATPMAWLLALWVGLRSAQHSKAISRSSRLLEAAVAGGILGLLEGFLFVAIMPMMGPIQQNERQKAVFLAVIVVVFGALISALLSIAIAAAMEGKRVS